MHFPATPFHCICSPHRRLRSIAGTWPRAGSWPSTSPTSMSIWSRPIALLAQAAGMKAMRVATGPKDEIGEFGATWMLLTDNAAFFAQPEVAQHAPARRNQARFEALDGRLFQPSAGAALTGVSRRPRLGSGVRQGDSPRCILSQDVHTPGVIASVFLKRDARRTTLCFVRRTPAGDSPHGRGRRQTGPWSPAIRTLDVLTDALMRSLCRPAPIPAQFTLFNRFAIANIPSDPSLNVIPHPSNPAPLFGRRPAQGVRPTAGEGEAP